MNPIRIFGIAIVLVLAISSASAAQKKTLAFVVNGASDFWKMAEAGVKKAQAELPDYRLQLKYPEQSAVAVQQRVMENLVAAGAAGIVVSPIDPRNATEGLNKIAARALLFTTDSDAPKSKRFAYVGSSNTALGKVAGQLVLRALPNGGKCVGFVGLPGADNARERIEGVKAAIKGSGVSLVDVRGDDIDLTRAKRNVEDVLAADPDIACLIGFYSYNTPLIYNVLKEAGKLGQIKVIGFDEDPITLGGIREGTIEGTVVQQPFEWAYQSMKLMARVLAGDESGVPANRVVIIPGKVIDKSNVDVFTASMGQMMRGEVPETETPDVAFAVPDQDVGKSADAGPTPVPPVITILSPGDGDSFTGGEAKVIYDVRSPAGAAVNRIEVLVDGEIPRGLERADEGLPAPGSTAGQIRVPLPNRNVSVSLIAHAGNLVSTPATIKLVWVRPADNLAQPLVKPKLYALVVGVSQYADRSLTLHYAAKDASDFTAALRAQGGGLYGAVDVKLIVDGDATRASILDGLDWLEHAVTSHDIGIVYLAGHGWTDEHGDFWYLPADATPERARLLAVPNVEILRTMNALAGKAVVFIDACHAASAAGDNGTQLAARGPVDVTGAIKDFANAQRGVVAFFSSQGREPSYELDGVANGAFTKALVEGLQGKADVLTTGQITLSGLDAYVVNRVKQLTGGRQHPVMTRPSTLSDFPIGLVEK